MVAVVIGNLCDFASGPFGWAVIRLWVGALAPATVSAALSPLHVAGIDCIFAAIDPHIFTASAQVFSRLHRRGLPFDLPDSIPGFCLDQSSASGNENSDLWLRLEFCSDGGK